MDTVRIKGRGFVDEVTLVNEISRRGQAMVVAREYDRVREGMDLAAGEPWVLWRRALQGGSTL